MSKCEMCYDWCSRVDITKQWWNIAKNDWTSLNGKDLPYYIAILTVLRETTKEIFSYKRTDKNHSSMKKDKDGYTLVLNKDCRFIPLEKSRKKAWHGLDQTIRVFRNGAAHMSHINYMNPVSLTRAQLMNPEDSYQDYYRYAPFPDLKCRRDDLRAIHELIRETILDNVRSPTSNVSFDQIKYEFWHVERGPFIDLLNEKMVDLLKEVNVW